MVNIYALVGASPLINSTQLMNTHVTFIIYMSDSAKVYVTVPFQHDHDSTVQLAVQLAEKSTGNRFERLEA